MHVTIIIDVFRAFTTASYVLEQSPKKYILTSRCHVISRLAKSFQNPLLIGKPEKGSHLLYDIPNSPTRTKEVKVKERAILHRTEAGAKGILKAKNTDLVLAVGLVNANATAQYIHTLPQAKIEVFPMGHEGITPSIEDHICQLYIQACLRGEKMALSPFLSTLRKGPGRYFFSQDQWQYPIEDFECCINTGRFNFAIQAEVKEDYAVLSHCGANHSLGGKLF